MKEPGKEVDYSPCGQGLVRNGLGPWEPGGGGGGGGGLPIGLVRGQVSSSMAEPRPDVVAGLRGGGLRLERWAGGQASSGSQEFDLI